ncbi:MAG: hypothetical protein WC477_02495 [Patescibacteria group bacterium]
MWLFLDTSSRSRLRLALFSQTGVERLQDDEGERRPLVALLSAFISHRELTSLTGVCVVKGPGSFSAIRSGVLIANLLSRLYHIPLVGISCDEAVDLALVAKRVHSRRVGKSKYVAPVYDAEPNITKKGVGRGA